MKRVNDNEIMDDFSIGGEEIEKALKELKVINTYLGGNSTTSAGLNILTKKSSDKSRITILDAGAGASDVLISASKQFRQLKITSLDANQSACKYITKNHPTTDVVCGSTESLPIKENSFDVVHASLFFHHFDERTIINTLNDFSTIATKGIIINDLERSIWAYIGIKLLTLFFSRSYMVKNDAPLSVKRGFKKSELVKILDELNYTYVIKRKWAFRFLVVVFFNDAKQVDE